MLALASLRAAMVIFRRLIFMNDIPLFGHIGRAYLVRRLPHACRAVGGLRDVSRQACSRRSARLQA